MFIHRYLAEINIKPRNSFFHWCKQVCGSALIVCGSESRTIKSLNFSKHLIISKSQKYFQFSSLNLNLKHTLKNLKYNILYNLEESIIVPIPAREKNEYPWIHGPKWMRIRIYEFLFSLCIKDRTFLFCISLILSDYIQCNVI